MSFPAAPIPYRRPHHDPQAGKWSRANTQKILELMHRDGLVVLDGCISDLAILDQLRLAMAKTSNEIKATKTSISSFNHGVATNFMQSPPLSDKSLLFEEVYANKFAVQAVEAYLGKGLALAFLGANTALASTTDRQPVHKVSLIHSAELGANLGVRKLSLRHTAGCFLRPSSCTLHGGGQFPTHRCAPKLLATFESRLD